MRVESTITESNGSSSMASVCGGCLAMLDAGGCAAVLLCCPDFGVLLCFLVVFRLNGGAVASFPCSLFAASSGCLAPYVLGPCL